ncbi:MAG: helicase [Chloroflexi bacterium]|nr:helicase [Chloroflexota bacterium]
MLRFLERSRLSWIFSQVLYYEVNLTSNQQGKDLFIVDNGISGWTALRYLEEWTKIANSFDIATSFFEVGSLLALDGKWQQLSKIRILMGSEMTMRTKRLLLDSVSTRILKELDSSIEIVKEPNPFLNGVSAILEALKNGQIECRVYDQGKFHAKTFITHSKLEIIGSQALVGSSNFTAPGLSENIELNVQIQNSREVNQLQEWFESHWKDAAEVTDAVIQTVERHTREYHPFHIYAKALQEFFSGHEVTASEWEETQSKMFPVLDLYQKEAYWTLHKIAQQHKGAFLCDGVGLGKTFVGLMLIERLILHEGKRVLLLAPKGAREAVWEPDLKRYLAHIGGISGSADFSNLAIFSHTDLGRSGNFPERFQRMSELADVVIIDEVHHFRNPGQRGNPEEGKNPSRYYQLYNLLNPVLQVDKKPKTLFMFTATPINNGMSDFRHLIELFSKGDERFFSRTIGIPNLRSYFNQMEHAFRSVSPDRTLDISEHLHEANSILSKREIFQNLVVQRSRSYVKESQLREKSKSTSFPKRLPPKVAEYSIRKTHGKLLDMIEKSFDKAKPLFTLPIYYPLAYYKGDDSSIDPFDEGRQKQVVGLIRTVFLKRFESSIVAFEASCDRLMRKLLAFLEIHSESPQAKRRLERWKDQHSTVIQYALDRQMELWSDIELVDPDEDIVSEQILDAVDLLDRDQYDVDEIIAETFLDLDQIIQFLDETRRFEHRDDDKLQKLIQLINSEDLKGKKVLIFTEFADTARYLKNQLQLAGVDGLEEIDSANSGDRRETIERFAPYYNHTTSGDLEKEGKKEIRVLISTDILAEGINLQDATRLINYDIHWNPVRLMQRIGRVDRRLNPDVEAMIIKNHPQIKSERGTVAYWNFLPPEELNAILTLYTRITHKTLVISKTQGIEGKKLLTPEDEYDALRDFNEQYEGTRSELEDLRLEYEALLKQDPELKTFLDRLPRGIFSGREHLPIGLRGVFLCYSLPALDSDSGEFTLAAGFTRWYFYDNESDKIFDNPGQVVEWIRSSPETPRKLGTDKQTLIDIRTKVLNHIKNDYLKKVDAPIEVKPVLKCWMEVN